MICLVGLSNIFSSNSFSYYILYSSNICRNCSNVKKFYSMFKNKYEGSLLSLSASIYVRLLIPNPLSPNFYFKSLKSYKLICINY